MRKKLVFSVSVLVFALVVVLVWPTAGYDINRVNPSLRELATPYQSVDANCYLDGGSISVVIVDRDSRKLELALPVSAEHGRSFPRLFIGAKHMSKTGAVEVAFSEDTRRMLISAIEQHRQPTNYNDLMLVYLRGSPRDHARVFGSIAVRICQSLVK